MPTLTCPKCRQGLTDDSLDTGQCPLCGFPLDGPVVLGTPATHNGTRFLLGGGLLVVLVGAGIAGYAFRGRPDGERTAATALRSGEEPVTPTTVVTHLAPFPHEPVRPDAGTASQNTDPQPGEAPGRGDKNQPPAPAVIEVPKKDGPRPVAVMMKVDPKIAPRRHFDNPDDIATLPDLNTGDRVILTGRLRTLRIHSVNGKGSLDASGLIVEEVEIRGDLNSESQVMVNAPQGKVRVDGFVMGSAKLTANAPGGTVTFRSRLTGGSSATITAKRLEALGVLSGGTKVNVTLTAGGSLKIAKAEEGAMVTYRKAAAGDPPPVIEKGEFRGGARIIAGK